MNIEESIKYLKNIQINSVGNKETEMCESCIEVEQAIETIIEAYKEQDYEMEYLIREFKKIKEELDRQKEINEEHKKINGELQIILTKEKELTRVQTEYDVNKFWEDKIKEKIEELKDNIPYLSKFNDWKEEEYKNEDIINNCIQVLEELLEEGE